MSQPELPVREKQVPPPKAGILQVAKAVFWSFFGVRRRRDYESDAARITPVQAIVAGLTGWRS